MAGLTMDDGTTENDSNTTELSVALILTPFQIGEVVLGEHDGQFYFLTFEESANIIRGAHSVSCCLCGLLLISRYNECSA